MKKITKYDIADLVLLYVGITFFPTFLFAIFSISFLFRIESAPDMDKGMEVAMQLIYILALGIVNYVLFFKRPFLIHLILPESADSQVEVNDGLLVLTRYSFWIRLFGIMTFLSYGVSFCRELAIDLAAEGPIDFGGSWWMGGGTQLISTIAGLLIVWKADWIAEKLQKLGTSKSQFQHGDDLPKE